MAARLLGRLFGYGVGCGVGCGIVSTLGAADANYRLEDDEALQLSMEQLNTLATGGVVVVDNALGADAVTAARSELFGMQERLSCTAQGAAIRNDSVAWIHEGELALAGNWGLAAAVARLKRLAPQLRGKLPHRLVAPEHAQASIYRGGAQYTAHRDNRPYLALGDDDSFAWLSVREQSDRQITAILYLNEAPWDAEVDGGCLRCFVGAAPDDTAGATASHVIDVAPVGGRLVLFDSRALLHAVLPANRPRAALSVWLLGEQGRGRAW